MTIKHVDGGLLPDFNIELFMDSLYKDEINWGMATFFDEGYVVMLGDSLNGYKAQAEATEYRGAMSALLSMVCHFYPASETAEKYITFANKIEIDPPAE